MCTPLPAVPSPTPRGPGTPRLRDSGRCGLTGGAAPESRDPLTTRPTTRSPGPHVFLIHLSLQELWGWPAGTARRVQGWRAAYPHALGQKTGSRSAVSVRAQRKGSRCQFWGSHRPGQAQETDDISSERGPCHLHPFSHFRGHPRAGSEGREPPRGRHSRDWGQEAAAQSPPEVQGPRQREGPVSKLSQP